MDNFTRVIPVTISFMTANLIFVLTVVVTVINSQRQEIHYLPNLKKWFMEIFPVPVDKLE